MNCFYRWKCSITIAILVIFISIKTAYSIDNKYIASQKNEKPTPDPEFVKPQVKDILKEAKAENLIQDAQDLLVKKLQQEAKAQNEVLTDETALQKAKKIFNSEDKKDKDLKNKCILEASAKELSSTSPEEIEEHYNKLLKSKDWSEEDKKFFKSLPQVVQDEFVGKLNHPENSTLISDTLTKNPQNLLLLERHDYPTLHSYLINGGLEALHNAGYNTLLHEAGSLGASDVQKQFDQGDYGWIGKTDPETQISRQEMLEKAKSLGMNVRFVDAPLDEIQSHSNPNGNLCEKQAMNFRNNILAQQIADTPGKKVIISGFLHGGESNPCGDSIDQLLKNTYNQSTVSIDSYRPSAIGVFLSNPNSDPSQYKYDCMPGNYGETLSREGFEQSLRQVLDNPSIKISDANTTTWTPEKLLDDFDKKTEIQQKLQSSYSGRSSMRLSMPYEKEILKYFEKIPDAQDREQAYDAYVMDDTKEVSRILRKHIKKLGN